MSSRNDPSSRFFRDPNLVEEHRVKSYLCPELVIEVCRESNLPCKLLTWELNADFVTIYVTGTKLQYKTAQAEWCRRMSIGGITREPLIYSGENKPTIDLFA